jgi:uncharacterized protein with PIN domain
MLESNYNEIKLTQRCPHCNGELMQLSCLDPTSFGFQTKTKIVCTNCHRELQRSDLKVTEPIEEKNESIELPDDAMMGWICPRCDRSLSPYINECPCSIKYELTCDSNSTAPLKIEDIGNCEV